MKSGAYKFYVNCFETIKNVTLIIAVENLFLSVQYNNFY